MRLLGWLAVAAVLQIAYSAKILSILPMGVKSHSILYDRLMKELAKRGHEITYLTPFKSKEPTKNIKEILLPDLRYVMISNNTNLMLFSKIPPALMMGTIPLFSAFAGYKLLQEPQIQSLIESDEKFDLIFGEPQIDETLIAGFSHKSGAPIVILNTLMPNVFSNFMVGNPATSSYIPDPFVAVTPPLSFLQRTYSFIFSVLAEATHRFGLLLQDRLLRTYFDPNAPCLSDILRNTSLLLVNHHPALSFARPQTPNTIDVAGMHIYPPKPLPKDLKNYLDKSTNGAILFSMGTNVKSSDFSNETITGILSALGRLKENILWKFETELPNLPTNVKIEKWLPQSDILAHPNLKLFITHGGLLSTTEAVFRGVPVVGIPIMADQPINMQHTENAGFGKTLNVQDITEESLYNTVTEVLSNPKYREVVQSKSRILQDAPMEPLETAVWWIEYVIRNKGAPHLRSPIQQLWWYQIYNLDVLIFLTLVTAATLVFDVWIVKKAYKYVKQRRSQKSNSTKEKSTKNKKQNKSKKAKKTD